MNVRYSEIFFSFQGEAEMTGQPSVWLRFFGCNLNCSGFGQKTPTDPSTYELPYKDFDASLVTKVEDLPVWTKGCDSSYSWSAKFRHLAHVDTVEGVATKLELELAHPTNPQSLFTHPGTGQQTMLSFTGGEPMLQQKAMIAIMEELRDRQNFPHTINIETNATQPLSPELRTIFGVTKSPGGLRWHFSMSPKLFTVSGEQDAVKYDTIFDYATSASSSVLKFVCNGTPECWEELEMHATALRELFKKAFCPMPPIWIMPVGATKDEQEEQWVQDLNIEVMKRGYNVANRLQCFVFGNVIGR